MAQFKGDLNNDGRIQLIDFILAFKASAGQVSGADLINRGDVNGDGAITISGDVRPIMYHLQGQELIDGVMYDA